VSEKFIFDDISLALFLFLLFVEAYNRRFSSRLSHKHLHIWRFIHLLEDEVHNFVHTHLHQLMEGVAGLSTQRRTKAIKAAKKTVQIIKLHRLFTQQKKTLGEPIFDLSFLVGDALKNKKTGKK
jgi:hypothetical protein